MAADNDSDWSDSDDEEVSGMETSVLLGVPDGPMEEQKDAEDAAVSRIGGYPVRLFALRLIVCTVDNNRNISFVPYARFA